MQNPLPVEATQRDLFSFLSRVPSVTYIYAMLGSVVISAFLYLIGRRHTALFIGEWAPTLVGLGLFYKLLHPSGESVGQRFEETFGQVGR